MVKIRAHRRFDRSKLPNATEEEAIVFDSISRGLEEVTKATDKNLDFPSNFNFESRVLKMDSGVPRKFKPTQISGTPQFVLVSDLCSVAIATKKAVIDGENIEVTVEFSGNATGINVTVLVFGG